MIQSADVGDEAQYAETSEGRPEATT